MQATYKLKIKKVTTEDEILQSQTKENVVGSRLGKIQ